MIERLKQEDIDRINSLEKEKQKKKELEKFVDAKITDAVIKIFPDDKKILSYIDGKNFLKSSQNSDDLIKYLQGKTLEETGDSDKYLNFLTDLVKFKTEVQSLDYKKTEEIERNTKDTRAEVDELKNKTLDKYKTFSFLADGDSNFDDITTTTNIKKFKKSEAAAFGGSKNLLLELGKYYDRAGEEIFVAKIVDRFNKVLKSKGIATISATDIASLKAAFVETKNGKEVPKLVKADIKIDGKNKKKDVSMTDLFVNSISAFTGNLDRYFDTGDNISDEINKIDIKNLTPEQATLGLNIYISEHPDSFRSDYENYIKDQRPTDKQAIENQIKETKDKKTKTKLEKLLNPNAIYFNGLVLGYMQHYHTSTLESLGNKGEVVKSVTGTTKENIYTLGASAGMEISKNLTAILGGNMTYAAGKFHPGINAGLSENLGKGFAVSINAGTLITNLQSVSALIGLTKNFNLSDGSKKGTANLDLSAFVGSDLLNGFVPSAGLRLDRNKMLGIAKSISELRSGLTIAISEAISQGKDKAYIVDRLTNGSGSKDGFQGIDPKLAEELVNHIYPVVESLGKVEVKLSEREKAEIIKKVNSNDSIDSNNKRKEIDSQIAKELSIKKLKLNIYIQENITDNLLTDIATGKFKSSNKFGFGGIGFSTNDIMGLGVPFLARILGTSIKKNKVATTYETEGKTVLTQNNEKIGTEQIDKLNKYFMREESANDKKFSEQDGIITVPSNIKIMLDSKELVNNANQAVKTIDTREYNISIKGGQLSISPVNKNTLEQKHIDVIKIKQDTDISEVFNIDDKGDSILFTVKEGDRKYSIKKTDIAKKGISIDPTKKTVTTNGKANSIEKVTYKSTDVPIIIAIDSSKDYIDSFTDPKLGYYKNGKKTETGQQLATALRDTKSYAKFTKLMDTNSYTLAKEEAKNIIKEFNDKLLNYSNSDKLKGLKKINLNFDKSDKLEHDLTNFRVMLISRYYTEGKIGVQDNKYNATLTGLESGLNNNQKAIVNTINNNQGKSLYEIKFGNESALEQAKKALLQGHKELYIKLLTVGDIATQSVFYKKADNSKVDSRTTLLKKYYPENIAEAINELTLESLNQQQNNKKIAGLRNYETSIFKDGANPVAGFVMGYPGEKFATDIEIISGSDISVKDKVLKLFIFKKLIKGVPDIKAKIKSSLKISNDSDLEKQINGLSIDNITEEDGEIYLKINNEVKIKVNDLKLALYAHCNGNHTILAPGLELITTELTKKSESIITGYGDLNIQDTKSKTRVAGQSKGILDIVGGLITSKNKVSMSTSANDETMNTGANDVLGKEIKVTINGVEKTVKIIEIPNSGGKLQMAVVGGNTAEVYTLTPDRKGTITINDKLYTATKNNTSAPGTGATTGIPSSGSNAPVTVTIPNIPSSPTGPLTLRGEQVIPIIYNIVNANRSMAEEKNQDIDPQLLGFIKNNYNK